jgi:RHS repeat-associated protein
MESADRNCWFAYSENKKEKTAFTDVFNQHSHLTRYNYSTDDYRLRTIQRFKGNGPYQLYRVDRLRWGEEGSKNESNLITRAILDGQDNIQFAENFHYDDRGNVTKKTTHFERATSLDKKYIGWTGKRVSGGEVRTVRSEYNALNLPVLESDGRLTTRTSYLEKYHQKRGKIEQTSLVSARLKSDAHRIFSREFFDYDQAIGCTLHIVDDGSGTNATDLSDVRKRVITRHKNKTGIFAGLPLETSTFGWDRATGSEKLLGKVEFDYDSHGFNKEERHYDSENVLRYSIQKQRDIQGNIVFETNALGEPTSRVYNKYGCLLREQGPCPELYTEYCYDLLQRPIKQSNIYSDDLILTTRTTYDLDNLPTKEEGIYGECTYTSYNEQKLPEIVIKPAIRLEEGLWESPKITFTYDIFGHLTSQTDASGAITYYQYTPEGKIVFIQHPDSTTEHFRYSIYGELIEKITVNGSKTVYTHDSQGRVVSEVTFDANSALLKTHTFVYEGSLLVAEKDGDLVTKYEYDYAGRILRKQVGMGLTEYFYDTLGRQVETRVFFGDSPEEFISYQKEYDLLNRVLSEREADNSGKIHSQIHYTYDERGNETSVTTYNHAGIAVTRKCYDPRGHLCSETDALGNTTRYIHHYQHQLEGRTLPCVEKIDPTGVKTVSISDHHGNPVSEWIYSPFGDLISREERFYDISGNLSRTEYILPQEIIRTDYEYDSNHRLIRQTNGVGTPEELTTRFVYNSRGELCETCYADGTSKFHSYDGVGRLSLEWSSDQSIVYSYTYDQQNNPIQIDNVSSGRSTKRVYTPEGHLLSETFENGLTVRYTHDKMGRVITFTYPDGSSVHKRYNPNSLSKIQRIKDGIVIHEIGFENFDLSGIPNTIQFPKNTGVLSLEYDFLNRPLKVSYPQHKESDIAYDSRGLLIAKTVNAKQERYEHDDLMQLTLEQTSTYSRTYQNDALNRQVVVDGIAQIHNAVHQLTQGAHGESVFDHKGRRIRDNANVYAYDAFDRLQTIEGKTQLCHYTYDAFNRKMSRECEGSICYYIYDGNEEIGSYDATGRPLDTKVLSDGEGSLPVGVELDDQFFTPLLSSQGHIVGLVDIETGAYVNKSPTTMFGIDLSTDPLSPWRFCGKRHEDGELGVIDFGFRHYHPQSAQWLTQDPIGDADGPNLYAYVRNNPTRCIDKFGLFMDDFNFTESWGKFKQSCSYAANIAADYTYRSPRFTGGAQAVGGLIEAAAGGSSALATGGVASIPGFMVMAHGLDHFFSGCAQISTGKFQDTATVQALTATGLSHETASLIDGGLSVAGTGWCASRCSILPNTPIRYTLKNNPTLCRKIKLHVDKQNKHVIGKHNYEKGKSIFTHKDPQGLLDKYAGKGIPTRNSSPGSPNYRERVDFKEIIGYHVDPMTLQQTPTTIGEIHFSKTGAHIVPMRPK